VVYKKSKQTGKLRLVGYLSRRDEQRGMDSRLDMQGYVIVAL